MNVTVLPSRACGTAVAPPSKSMAHRALICAALAGDSTVKRLAYSKDVEATLGCLQSLGVTVTREGDTVHLSRLDLTAVGGKAALFCNESGSTLRFMIPLCMLTGVPVTFSGSERLFQRPLTVYERIADEQGITFESGDGSVTVCGKLQSGDYTVAGDISSQFISGLLFALPLSEGDSRLTVTGNFESESYVGLTLSVLDAFGVQVTREGNTYHIKGGRRYQSGTYTVEGDCSNAAFLEALNLLGGTVTVEGLNPDTLQGDRVYAEYFAALQAGKTQFDLTDCPDLGPVLFAMAAVTGTVTFTGTARLRIKESDRAAAMAAELKKFGVEVAVGENTVTVYGGKLQPPSQPLCGHNDHRIVMALTLLCTVTGGTVTGAQAVAKSYPDFFEQLRALGIGMTFDET